LFIPLFNCSDGEDIVDNSPDSIDEPTQTLREFLDSNIFIYQDIAIENNETLFDYFVDYPFTNGYISRDYMMTSEDITNECQQVEYNYNECYRCREIWQYSEVGSIYEETDTLITWQAQNQFKIEITRLDNETINVRQMNGSTGMVWSDTPQTVTTYEYFNERLNAINNVSCPCNQTCPD